MGLSGNSYAYTDKLLALESTADCVLAQKVSGFLPIAEWEPYLRTYPDQRMAAFLRRGIQYGFRIGFSPSQSLERGVSNHRSVVLNPDTVTAYIADEVARKKLQQVVDDSTVHTSPMGIIPKANQQKKFRLICDLSYPQALSVNDGIDPDLCSLHYASVGDAVALVRSFGVGAMMAKLDLKSAYRMVPVHQQDQRLLGVSWQGETFQDKALPFGLRSAPIIFTAVADGLAWALASNGVKYFIHYLDDFFFAGPPGSDECSRALQTAVPLCAKLGLPVAPAKVEGPTKVLSFLGIELDTTQQELRLPQAKVDRLRDTLKEWYGRKYPSKRQLQSLIGQLNHAAMVVKPGRTFLRHLIDTMKIPKQGRHRVRLSTQCIADIHWWNIFINQWNGIAFFATPQLGVSVVSDASGKWGCGAFIPTSKEWFQFQWPTAWHQANIASKELFPIVVSAAIWGRYWARSTVLFVCDNLAVVQALKSRSVRDPCLMHMLRCLFFFEAHFNFDHTATHIPGKDNVAADALSRNRAPEFFELYPQAPRMPAVIPSQLCTLLSDQSLDWTSPRWRDLFTVAVHAVTPRGH